MKRDKLCIFHCHSGNVRLDTEGCTSPRVTASLQHSSHTCLPLESTSHRTGHKQCRCHPSGRTPGHSWPGRAQLGARVMGLCRTGSASQQLPSTRSRTRDRLCRGADPERSHSHRKPHTARPSAAGVSGMRSTQIRWCRLSRFHCRPSRPPCAGRSPVHTSPRSARPAAASWGPGRSHSDQRPGSSSHSPGGTHLAGSVGSSLPWPPEAGCPAGRADRSAGSRSPPHPGTRIPGTALPPSSPRWLWYVLCKHSNYGWRYIQDSTSPLSELILHPWHTPLWHTQLPGR